MRYLFTVLLFISSLCFAETSKEEDIDEIYRGTDDCASFDVLNKLYIKNKKVVESLFVCSLHRENKEFFEEIKEERSNAHRYSGIVDIKKLRELQNYIVYNNKVIKQFTNTVSCNTVLLKELLLCVDTNKGESILNPNSKCQKYNNLALLMDFFYGEMSLCRTQIHAPNTYGNCRKEFKFDSINKPPCD